MTTQSKELTNRCKQHVIETLRTPHQMHQAAYLCYKGANELHTLPNILAS